MLEKAAQLQPGFAKAHLNLGDAYRGIKEYEKAQAEYQRALQLFPNYADAVFNLGILYLDADKMPNMDLFAKENTAIQYFQRYKQMMGGTLPPGDPVDGYITEAQESIKKEEKRLERQKKKEERDARAPPRRPPTTPRRPRRRRRRPAPARWRPPGAPPAPGPAPAGPARAAHRPAPAWPWPRCPGAAGAAAASARRPPGRMTSQPTTVART